MKINPTPSTLVNNNVTTITSRVDPEGARRIMEMLVNLYSDQRLAVAREYVSNAVDATRAAGSTAAVAVTTPSQNEPNLIIVDRGTGMSMAEVEAAFLAFAASTKRNTNDMIGGLGVGAKSAWTLTESFLIDTVKDGKQTTVRAARNLEHQVLRSDAPSQEANGTTIIIPVGTVTPTYGPTYGSNTELAWRKVVQEVACAHDPGAVIVDGQPVDSIASGPRIGPVLCVRARETSWSDRYTIRSGGTLFDAVPEVVNALQRTTQLSACVLELPIGSFDHTPSRESVIATPRTMNAVNKALENYQQAYAALKQQVTTLAQTDIAAAIALRSKSLGKVGGTGHLPIPYELSVPAGQSWLHSSKHSARASWKRSETDFEQMIDALSFDSQISRTIVVSDVPPKKVLSQFARFLRDNHPMANRIIAIPQGRSNLTLKVVDNANPTHPQPTNQTMLINGQTKGIEAHYTFDNWTRSLASGRSARGPVRGYECAITDNNGRTYTDELSAADIVAMGMPVIYVEDTEYESYRHKKTSSPSITVYLKNRKAGPLLRAIPSAMTRGEWKEQQIKTVTASLSPAERLAMFYNCSRCDNFRPAFHVAAKAGLTTALVGLAGVANGYGQHTQHPKQTLLTEIGTLVDNAKKATAKLDDGLMYSMEKEFDTIDKLHDKLLAAYPLLRNVRAKEDSEKHLVGYVIHTPPLGG